MKDSKFEPLRALKSHLDRLANLADAPSPVTVRAAKLAVARALLQNKDWPPAVVSLRRQLKLPSSSCDVPFYDLLFRMSFVEGHSLRAVDRAVYELVSDEYLSSYTIWPLIQRGKLQSVPGSTWQVGDSLRPLGEPAAFAVVAPTTSLKILLVGTSRKCGPRDHLWLEWQLNDGLTVAVIRDHWNKLTDEERTAIAPQCSSRISNAEKGRDLVKKSIAKARRELLRQGVSDNEP